MAGLGRREQGARGEAGAVQGPALLRLPWHSTLDTAHAAPHARNSVITRRDVNRLALTKAMTIVGPRSRAGRSGAATCAMPHPELHMSPTAVTAARFPNEQQE